MIYVYKYVYLLIIYTNYICPSVVESCNYFYNNNSFIISLIIYNSYVSILFSKVTVLVCEEKSSQIFLLEIKILLLIIINNRFNQAVIGVKPFHFI